jgi:hypothetical protein
LRECWPASAFGWQVLEPAELKVALREHATRMLGQLEL